MLTLTDITKTYGSLTALAATSLSLEEAKTYVLLGPSGCGKSTLLRVMLGLVKPDAGTVHIGGELLTDENVLEMRRRVGYVIQNAGLFPHLTAKDNIAIVAKHLGWEAERIQSRLTELAQLTQLPVDCLDRFPAQLSGGQQQRVGLMRALMLEPDVLLMDEPLGALDPMIRSDLQSDLRAIFRELNKTVVIVTHDLHEAGYFADEILMLRSGRILQRGTIEDLLDSPADEFVARFINAQRVTLPGEDS